MITITRILLFLLANLFILNSTAISQKKTSPQRVISVTPIESSSQTPNSKTLVIVYSDGEQVELTHWLWYYTSREWVTPKKMKKSILGEIFNPPSAEDIMRDQVGE